MDQRTVCGRNLTKSSWQVHKFKATSVCAYNNSTRNRRRSSTNILRPSGYNKINGDNKSRTHLIHLLCVGLHLPTNPPTTFTLGRPKARAPEFLSSIILQLLSNGPLLLWWLRFTISPKSFMCFSRRTAKTLVACPESGPYLIKWRHDEQE